VNDLKYLLENSPDNHPLRSKLEESIAQIEKILEDWESQSPEKKPSNLFTNENYTEGTPPYSASFFTVIFLEAGICV